MKRNSNSLRAAGFTLVELIISASLSTIVITSMLATFMVFAKSSKSVTGYVDMSNQSRKVLEFFSRDVRAAADVVSATCDSFIIVYPDDAIYGSSSVEYVYDADFELFSRIVRDKAGMVTSNATLLDGVGRLNLDYFDPLGVGLDCDSESLLLSIKSVQLDAELKRSISNLDATDYIISARFMMRNRTVTQ